MKSRRGLQIAILLIALGLLAWAVTLGLARLAGPTSEPTPVAPAPVVPTAHITATLFYGSPDGQMLVPVRREVPLAEGVVAQGREILVAQLAAASGERQVIPPGTRLRAFYVSDRGDAFVDLSPEVSMAHPGGSLNELLTVYAIVNAVTANLPAVQRVQLLVDGKEVDTIAGHVDVRRPLARDASLVKETAP